MPSIHITSLEKTEKDQSEKKLKYRYIQYSNGEMLSRTANLTKEEKEKNSIPLLCTIYQKLHLNKPGIRSSLQVLFSFLRATGFWLRGFLVDHNCYVVSKCGYNL